MFNCKGFGQCCAMDRYVKCIPVPEMTEMGMSHGKGTSYFVALPPREWGQHLVNHGLSKKKNGGWRASVNASLPRLWKRSTVPNPLERWRQRHLLKNRSYKRFWVNVFIHTIKSDSYRLWEKIFFPFLLSHILSWIWTNLSFFELINTRSHFSEILFTSFRKTDNSQLGAPAVDQTGKLLVHRGEDVEEHEIKSLGVNCMYEEWSLESANRVNPGRSVRSWARVSHGFWYNLDSGFILLWNTDFQNFFVFGPLVLEGCY